MSNFYAQIDANNIVVGISDLGGVYNDSNYVIIDDYDLGLLGQTYSGSGTPGDPFDENEFENAPSEYNASALGASSCCLIFPESHINGCHLHIEKSTGSSLRDTTSSSFWSTISNRTDEFWVGNYTTLSHNTTRQTIVDINGEGILANVISPIVTGSGGTITVYITIDDEIRTFTSDALATDNRYILGYFEEGIEDTYKSFRNWHTPEKRILTPTEIVYKYRAGIKFTESLKIEIESSANISSSSYEDRAAFAYLTYIPEGF